MDVACADAKHCALVRLLEHAPKIHFYVSENYIPVFYSSSWLYILLWSRYISVAIQQRDLAKRKRCDLAKQLHDSIRAYQVYNC